MGAGATTLGTLSVLFTDIVGSTAQRARLGDDAADRLQQLHDEVVGGAIAGAGGTLVKGLGDGAMATFGAAADAVAAAVAIQQGLEQHGRGAPADEALSVRIGISIGDVSIEDGDVFGSAVVEASRLCGVAAGGEILVAELARMLARGRGGFTFEPVGEVELKGLPEPVDTCRVLWEPLPSVPTGQALPLPPPLTGPLPLGFVGRRALLDAIAADWNAVRGGEHRSVLLAGEPGIGKTRLATHAARAAHESGAVVLFGRCDEDLAMPYQPFVEALEHYVVHADDGIRLGRLPGELVRLVPQLAGRPGVGEPVASDPRSEEFRLFEAVTSWLTESARETGVVLVLDDLHWATKPTLQMLNHVLRHAPDSGGGGILTIITYRDTDIDRAHPLMGVLAELRRLPGVTRHPVGGLTEEEVVRLAATAAGHDLDELTSSLAGVVHAETEGNPFFVGEVLRHLVESGAIRRVDGRWQIAADVAIDVPEGVRDVVGRRVSRLSESANTVLSAAAVVGRDVPLDVLMEVTGLPEDAVLDALDEAVRARLVEETGADRYRFAHALVRTTLYDELSATRVRRLHRRVADATEKMHPDDLLGLARHLVAAGVDGGDATRACRSVIAAGRDALERRSPADAELWFRQGLELLEDASPNEELELEALAGLGEAQRDQGKPEFRETLLQASRRAVALGNQDVLVRSVLVNGRGFTSIIGLVDEERVELIEAALGALGERGDDRELAERARLTALLASELLFAGQAERQRQLAQQAVSLARTAGDPVTLAEVMVRTAFGYLDIDDPERNVRHADEAVELAQQIGDPSLESIACFLAAGYELTLGRMDRVALRTTQSTTVAEEASPNARWAAACHALKFVVGAAPIEETRAANDACLAMGEPLGEPDRVHWWSAGAVALAYLGDGGTGALADVIAEFADVYGEAVPSWWFGAAMAFADAGRHDEARAVIADLSVPSRRTSDDVFPYLGQMQAAQVAFALGDESLARSTQDTLAPHVDRWAHSFLVLSGPVVHPLGLCAATLGHHDRAVTLLEQAVSMTDAAGFGVLANRFRLDLGTVLVRRGDPSAGSEVLAAVASRADADGAVGVAQRARALMDQAVGSS